MKKQITAQIMISLISFFLMGCMASSTVENGYGDYTLYECDYKALSLNTQITTVVDGSEVCIKGDVFRLATDPLEMTDKNGNVLATASDTYNLFSQDDHGIEVDGNIELIMQGNFDAFLNAYKLFNADGEEIGYAKFGSARCRGTIYGMDNEVIANVQKSNPLGYDYNVKIYENNLCSDKAILMLAASYVSDYVADQE